MPHTHWAACILPGCWPYSQTSACPFPWSSCPTRESEQRDRQELGALLWAGHALRIPGTCFPEFLKIEDGNAFPFVLRIEKEELQVQGNGFHLVIGRNIQSHQVRTGIRQKEYLWFSGTAGKGEGGTEWREEGAQPRSLGNEQQQEDRADGTPGLREVGVLRAAGLRQAAGVVSCSTRPGLVVALSPRKPSEAGCSTRLTALART